MSSSPTGQVLGASAATALVGGTTTDSGNLLLSLFSSFWVIPLLAVILSLLASFIILKIRRARTTRLSDAEVSV